MNGRAGIVTWVCLVIKGPVLSRALPLPRVFPRGSLDSAPNSFPTGKWGDHPCPEVVGLKRDCPGLGPGVTMCMRAHVHRSCTTWGSASVCSTSPSWRTPTCFPGTARHTPKVGVLSSRGIGLLRLSFQW